MGQRGRKPRTEKEKTLRGNPGKRKTSAGAARSVAWDGIAGMPVAAAKTLSVTERTRFDAMVKKLGAVPGLLATVDTDLLILYVRAWTLIQQCDIAIAEGGLISYGETGSAYQNPAVSIRNKAIQQVREIGDKFGMNPKARQDIRPTTTETATDEFDEFLKRQLGVVG